MHQITNNAQSTARSAPPGLLYAQASTEIETFSSTEGTKCASKSGVSGYAREFPSCDFAVDSVSWGSPSDREALVLPCAVLFCICRKEQVAEGRSVVLASLCAASESLLGKIETPQLTRGTDIATCVEEEFYKLLPANKADHLCLKGNSVSMQVRTVSVRRRKSYVPCTLCYHSKMLASIMQDSCLARLAYTLLRLSAHPNEHCWFCRLELKRLGVTVALQLQHKMENQPPATPLLLQHVSLLGRTEECIAKHPSMTHVYSSV